MPATKKATAPKRSRDSFRCFSNPDFVKGLQPLGTLQPLQNGQQAGWFVKAESFSTCEWTATEDDFLPDSVLWSYNYRFNNGAREVGHFFIRPRIQIILESNILVCEADSKGMQRIVGDLSMPDIAEAFELDKQEAEEKNTPRRYNTRKKYLVNVMTKDNKPAHKKPLVLTVKGLVSTNLSEHLKTFRLEMDRTMCKLSPEAGAVRFTNDVHGTYIFEIELDIATMGQNNNAVAAISSFTLPTYETEDEAFESMDKLSIPDEDREALWALQKDPTVQRYIMNHSMADAAKLGGRYGVMEGVDLKPADTAIEVKALPATGENSEL